MEDFNSLKQALHEDEEITDLEAQADPIEDQIEDTEDAEENMDENHMEKFSAMLRMSLAEEHEAAAEYTKRAVKCEKHGLEDAAKLFRDIANEEVVHAGEFQALMEKYNLLNQDAIDQGEQEGKEIIDGEKSEPEIDSDAVPAEESNQKFIKEELKSVYSVKFDIATNMTADELEDHILKLLDVDNVTEIPTHVEIVNVTDDYAEGGYFNNESSNENYDRQIPNDIRKDYVVNGKNYTEREVRNLYSYELRKGINPYEQPEEYDAARDKAYDAPMEEVIDYLASVGTTVIKEAKEIQEDAEAYELYLPREEGDEPADFNDNLTFYEEYKTRTEAAEVAKNAIKQFDYEKIFLYKMKIGWDRPQYVQTFTKDSFDYNEDAAGSMATMGDAPTGVAGKGIVSAEPTPMCEELKDLKEALGI